MVRINLSVKLLIMLIPKFEEITEVNEQYAGKTWIEDCIDVKELD